VRRELRNFTLITLPGSRLDLGVGGGGWCASTWLSGAPLVLADEVAEGAYLVASRRLMGWRIPAGVVGPCLHGVGMLASAAV
jgi:hypothetical protein